MQFEAAPRGTQGFGAPFRFAYAEVGDLGTDRHVVPFRKYCLLQSRLLAEGIASDDDFVAPDPIPDSDLLLVHCPGYLQRLQLNLLSPTERAVLELPWCPRLHKAFWLWTGGTLLASQLALRDGIGFHIGGGFHHAFPDHGEGFCALHDVGVAIRVLQREGAIRRAMVVDLDAHQGNGTATIFQGDPTVFTFSMHGAGIYPDAKPDSDLDIALDDDVGDEEYLARLEQAYVPLLSNFQPELIIYAAGADPYWEDPLGGCLGLSEFGLYRRDLLVIGSARQQHIPIAVTLGGGYTTPVRKTVTLHANTVRSALECWAQVDRADVPVKINGRRFPVTARVRPVPGHGF
jgi:acetoin utilization deacetylase AcuC-like enzyme